MQCRLANVMSAAIVSTLLMGVPDVANSAQADIAAAELHYKIALVALEHKDLQSAESELKIALTFDPDNPLILFNLAIVESETLPREALRYLEKALAAGLPAAERTKAEDLRPRIMYAVGREWRGLLGEWKVVHSSDTGYSNRTEETTWRFSEDTAQPPPVGVADPEALRGFSIEEDTEIARPEEHLQCERGGRTFSQLQVTLRGSLVVFLQRNPRVIEVRLQSMSGTCGPGRLDVVHTYEIVARLDDELRVVYVGDRRREPIVFKKQ